MTVRLALTGPDGDGGSLGEGIRALGVETVGIPLLELVFLEDRVAAWERESIRTRRYDYVAFSSPRAVDAYQVLEKRTSRIEVNGGCLAVGPETARRLRASMVWSDEETVVEGDGSGVADLLRKLREIQEQHPGPVMGGVRGTRVFLPLSERAGSAFEEGLRALGAEVETLVLYTVRTVPDAAVRVHELVCETPDAVLLASPSAAEALVQGAGEERSQLPPLLAIGATTEEAMRKLALPVAGTAKEPTPVGIVAAMKERS